MNEKRESDMPLVEAVQHFMNLGGQTLGHFNPRQAALYAGLQCEELAEKIQAIGDARRGIQRGDALIYIRLQNLVADLTAVGNALKRGVLDDDVAQADRAELIDADFDLAWVSIGALASTSPLPREAVAHGSFTNLDKFRNGVVKDENGKIQKPKDWQRPNFNHYV